METMKLRRWVYLLVDRSGSMEGNRASTVSEINSFVGGLRQSPDEIELTIALFSASDGADPGFSYLVKRTSPKNAPILGASHYKPSGMTAFFDALVRIIRTADLAYRRERIARPHVISLAIVTDGEENSSTKNTFATAMRMVAKRQTAGWEFLFLSSDKASQQMAHRLGMTSVSSIDFSTKLLGQVGKKIARSTARLKQAKAPLLLPAVIVSGSGAPSALDEARDSAEQWAQNLAR